MLVSDFESLFFVINTLIDAMCDIVLLELKSADFVTVRVPDTDSELELLIDGFFEDRLNKLVSDKMRVHVRLVSLV